jgi:hypothetical protein
LVPAQRPRQAVIRVPVLLAGISEIIWDMDDITTMNIPDSAWFYQAGFSMDRIEKIALQSGLQPDDREIVAELAKI